MIRTRWKSSCEPIIKLEEGENWRIRISPGKANIIQVYAKFPNIFAGTRKTIIRRRQHKVTSFVLRMSARGSFVVARPEDESYCRKLDSDSGLDSASPQCMSVLELLLENKHYLPQFRKFSYFSFPGFIATFDLAGLRALVFMSIFVVIKRSNLQDGPIQFRYIYDENITAPLWMTPRSN